METNTIIEVETLDKQVENKPQRDELGRLLPGNTANPHGRPKGQTLKEYQAEKFRQMTDYEKEEWLKDVAKGERWRMSEGNPQTNVDQTTNGKELPQPIIHVHTDLGNKQNPSA